MPDTPEQTIADLRDAIDYVLVGDLIEGLERLEWLRSWRKGDKMREAIAAECAANVEPMSPAERRIRATLSELPEQKFAD